MNSPILSIIMPVYNAEPFIREAITSIISQSFTDFELIIVNDGSTDDSMEIVNGFNDSRIRILHNEKNSGIVFSRNKGIDAAKGKFIAPFDSDDIAMPEKFEKQIDFLKRNPDFGMIGSWAWLIDEHGKVLHKKWKVDASPERIPAILLFRNYFVQSAMVIRREAIPEGKYSVGFDIVEDYKMWIEISDRYKIWNYPEYLLKYRVHSKSITQREEEKMKSRDMMVFDFIYKSLGITLSEIQKELLMTLKYSPRLCNIHMLGVAEDFMLGLLDRNEKLRKYSQKELTRVIYNRWLKLLSISEPKNLKTITRFLNSPIHRKMLYFLFCR